MQEVQFITPLHNSSKRDYFARMTAEKPECMRVAKEYGADYWDGERKYGYGGYKYDGRWKPVAEKMIEYYQLKYLNKILDIGCGKGFLLDEFVNTTQDSIRIKPYGIDISAYAKRTALDLGNCTKLPYGDNFFDFTYSINVFHNLGYKDLKQAIHEMVRVSKDKMYICVESYRTEEDLCNLQMWALTCASFYTPDDWKNILSDNGFDGDVEFIYFQ